MVIASDWREKMPATQQRSTWESVRAQLRGVQMILSALGGMSIAFFSQGFFEQCRK